jgi:uncharacterized coiled-coil DUF342 family protein
MTKPENDRDQELKQELEGLQKEYDGLRERRIRIQSDLDHLKKDLADLESEAREKYGTADTKKLEEMLEEKRRENERLVAEYAAHVDGIKKELEKVERETGEGQGPE